MVADTWRQERGQKAGRRVETANRSPLASFLHSTPIFSSHHYHKSSQLLHFIQRVHFPPCSGSSQPGVDGERTLRRPRTTTAAASLCA